ncbi:MAG TPA: methyltransferase domain-containing protein [Gemmatimonadales bacterium]|nr:methyltransferase domain-containing protein [Gemmatimonadales bacterium]
MWLRHLVALGRAGMSEPPRQVAELGPGLSLGVGLAAMLTGATRYAALDVARDASPSLNLRLLGELEALVAARAPIPDDQEYPEILPRLKDYAFPGGILNEDRLGTSLAPDRRARLRQVVASLDFGRRAADGMVLEYRVPWTAPSPGLEDSFDLVVAQAVLEHVTDLPATYEAIARLLRPGGFLSCAIDFRSHGLTQVWNGHWTYSEPMWRLVAGRRRWRINRSPLSEHLVLLARAGLRVRALEPEEGPPGIGQSEFAQQFRTSNAADAKTCGVFLIAQRAI